MTEGPVRSAPGSWRSRSGARVALVLALSALALCILPGTAAQARVPKVFFGIDQGGYVTGADYQAMHEIKVRTVRLTINWSKVEPKRGVLRLGARAGNIDLKVAALAKAGITPAFTVFGAPEWATGSRNSAVPPLKPSALRAWKGFLKDVVARYRKGGEFWKQHPALRPRPARSWQIWNEPNLPKYFARPGTGPSQPVPHAPKAYAKLVKASDKAIHRADKHAKLILAGLSGNPKGRPPSAARFIKRFLRAKRIERHFDAAAIHPYTPKVKNYRSRLAEFRKALNRGGAKRKPIWLTEVGWGSDNDSHPMNKGLIGQAKILRKSFRITLKNRKRWKIDRLYWFDWRDPAPQSRALCTFCPSAGLLRYDGSHKPSYKRFKRFARKQGRGGHRHRRR